MRARCAAIALGCGVAAVACGAPEGEAPPLPVAVAEKPDAGAAEAPDATAADGEDLGRWRKLRPARFDAQLTAEQRARIEELEAIGYLSGTVEARPGRSGVRVHDPGRSQPGLNFYTSGHAAEAVLMDMEGGVLHRWRFAFSDIWPDYPKQWLKTGAGFWRRAHLFENGDLLAIYEGMGIIKLDRDSNLIWSNPITAHHDLEVMPNGEIYVLAREAHVIPRLDPESPLLEDFIAVLGPDGVERRRVSVLESFENSEFNALWSVSDARMGDLFHTNSLEVLDGRSAGRLPSFAAGNVLISLLLPSVIAVVDLDATRVIWAQRGDYKSQHDPKLLADGTLLLFENRGRDRGWASSVIEIDPATGKVGWEYRGDASRPFFSLSCGAAQRLANGNTLISESDGGRAFEVARDGEIVWEFYNPHRAGEDAELIATLFEMVRLRADFPVDWARP